MLDINHHFQGVFHHTIPMIYLVDYTTGKYLTMSKSVRVILGYEPENFINGGLAFTMENYHKTDLRVFNEQIFPDRLSFLKRISPAEHSNYIFSYNFRIRNKEKNYSNILQRNCFIKSDDKGNPLMSLGMVINVDHYKSESPVIQLVDKLSSHPNESPQTVYKKAFYLHEEDKLFTKREKEVLLCVADGLTSREIADKLFISENTIINHRRNMQEKSNTSNAAGLVGFALRQGII
jgi:DNA-binding CsgD family transcriptional regulator